MLLTLFQMWNLFVNFQHSPMFPHSPGSFLTGMQFYEYGTPLVVILLSGFHGRLFPMFHTGF